MEKDLSLQSADTMRSNEAMPQSISKSAKAGKSTNRSYFSRAKQKTIDMYRKVYSTGFLDSDQQKADEQKVKCLRMCLTKTLDGMKGYNEEGFKKDLSMRMARLINDKRFDRSCKRAQKCLYEEAQRLAWAQEKVFQQILIDGIDHVKGFYTPDLVIFKLEDIRKDILFNDVDPDDLDDRYSKKWCEKHPAKATGKTAVKTKQKDKSVKATKNA
jgi:hypothetical protein